jgi:hypothetical protein
MSEFSVYRGRQLVTNKPTAVQDYNLGAALFGYTDVLDDPRMVDGTTMPYVVEDIDWVTEAGDWEVGIGTLNDLGGGAWEVQRTTFIASSTGSAIDWSGSPRQLYLMSVLRGGNVASFMVGSNNLSEITTPATARTSLNLGDVATHDTGSGNGLDADQLDGVEAAGYLRDAETGALIDGQKTWSGALSISGDQTWTGPQVYDGASGGRMVWPVGANLWAT